MPNANFSKRIIDTNIKRIRKIHSQLEFEVSKSKHFKVSVINRLNKKSKTFFVSSTSSSKNFSIQVASDFNKAIEEVEVEKLSKNSYLISFYN